MTNTHTTPKTAAASTTPSTIGVRCRGFRSVSTNPGDDYPDFIAPLRAA
jgi:hypothetical protein